MQKTTKITESEPSSAKSRSKAPLTKVSSLKGSILLYDPKNPQPKKETSDEQGQKRLSVNKKLTEP